MSFIQQQIQLFPQLTSQYTKLGDLCDKKLYYELTVELEAFVHDRQCHQKDNLIQLYNGFIKPIQDRLNSLKLMIICGEISLQFQDKEKAIAFLQSLIDSEEKKQALGQEASLMCLFKIGLFKLKVGGDEYLQQVKTMIEENKITVESLVGAEPIVHSGYYQMCCSYYQSIGPASSFYKNALMFLAYTPYEDLEPKEQFEFATAISLAALTGEDVYNFGEVLATPILKALEGTDKQWLSDLLYSFNGGNIDKFNAIVNANRAAYESQPALVNMDAYVKEKIALLALMELVFHRPAHERNIAFADIAEATRLPLDQVEWLVMRSMSVKLIKGTIDQVDQMVAVSWVQPRVLDDNQISNLKERLDVWGKKVNETLLMVEDHTPELFE